MDCFLLSSNILHLLVLLRLVLRIFAAWLVLQIFAAAPPNLTAPHALVHPAAPVEVLRLDVVFCTILAYFLTDVDFTLP